MKIPNDKANVIIRWLVIVKLYGTNPIRLLNKIKEKITVIKGKYFSLPVLTKSNTSCETTSYTDSKTTCHGLGMKKKEDLFKLFLFELKKYIVPLKHKKARMFTSKALVIEKSKPNISIVTSDKIWNCSKGDNSNIMYF